jgi:signal recognition particle GTPase
MTKPLRCHLLIGPPASGKTTLAHKLSPLLRGPKGEPGLVLSTDVIRAELFGDAAVQGPWPQIRERLQERLLEAVAAARSVLPVLALTELLLLLLGAGRMLWERELLAELLGLAE